MRRRGKWVAVVVGVAALAAIGTAVAATTSNGSAGAKGPIVIGWAFDSTGTMAPFDNPALAAAKIRVGQWNAKGGVLKRKLELRTCDTQGNKPDIAKSCAQRLLDDGANVIMTTCDVELAAPVVQEAINHGTLAVASCIGTDQMGPKRFGSKGRLAFTFGNVAQDEGSAMAQYAWSKGWRKAALATDSVIIYFRNVVQAFDARWKQLGGKVVARETYQSLGGNNVQNVVSRLNGVKADVIVTSTAGAFGALSTLISGLRGPIGVAVSDGFLYVTNLFEGTVGKYTIAGETGPGRAEISSNRFSNEGLAPRIRASSFPATEGSWIVWTLLPPPASSQR